MKLAKTYEPQQYEPNIYALWESSGAFEPTPIGKKGTYSIVLPPPNANGNLHIGHALTVAVEDVLIRYNRMKGKSTVFIPGADHAGFETWVVFEKSLALRGKTRFDYSRESIYAQVWDFVEQQRGNMEVQLRELGASVDWKSLVFTLDKKVIDTAYDTFKKLWDEGLIYRGERIVNYCTKHQTSFADIEVEHRTEASKIWKIAYTLIDKVGEIVVATTRPETLLGDTAIAVNPNDERYKELIGTKAWVPIVGREIPIVGDEAVDPAFGTGAVKVTPAHDPTDFEMGQRHGLEVIQVIGFDGRMTHEAPPAFHDMTVSEARQHVLRALQVTDAMRGEEDYSHSVGHCYKCGTIIEPMVKEQWFVKVQPLAERAKRAIADGEIKFYPEEKGRELIRYYDNLRDWNLSRQIPWGIPIPAFQNVDDLDDWIFDTRVDQKFIEVDGKSYHREEDTFDTWFSSGQWPFITTDFVDRGKLTDYYPLSVMETGHDILYPWISRMIMLGLYRTGIAPFRDVYLHGLVLDEHSKKMSKSKGNVINPQDIIKEYGSDAMRMGIIASRSAGMNQAFSTSKVIAGRNFANKLWNIARYVEDKVGDSYTDRAPKPVTLADHWILYQLNNATKRIGRLLEDYRFAEAYEVMYHTVWDDFADWYLEASKVTPNNSVLAHSLETVLKLAHPFAPFVTETIWETLAWEEGLLIVSSWPGQTKPHATAAHHFEQLQRLITEARFIAKELGGGKRRLLFEDDKLVAENAELLRRLAGLEEVKHIAKPKGLRLAVAGSEAWIDVDAKTLYDHQTRLEERLAECREQITKLEGRLGNKSYVKNAPKTVVEQTRDQLKDHKDLETRLVKELEVL